MTHSLFLFIDAADWYINLGKYEMSCDSLPLIEAPMTTKVKDDSAQKLQLIFITMVGCNIFGIIAMFFLFSIREWEVKEEMREKYSSRRTKRTKKPISDIFEDLVNEDEVLLSNAIDSSVTQTKVMAR
jgi:Na+/melibiose symporter-like transporter